MAQQDRNTPQNQPPLAAPAPAANPDLASQLLDLVKSDKSVALAIGQALSSTAEGRQMLGISGKNPKKPQQQATNDDVKRHVMAYGEVTREPGFVPVPPESISSKGPAAVEAWQEAWKEGRHINPYDVEHLSEGAILASHN